MQKQNPWLEVEKYNDHPVPCTEPVQVEESVEEGTVASEVDGNNIREKLKSTIEKIKQMISDGAYEYVAIDLVPDKEQGRDYSRDY